METCSNAQGYNFNSHAHVERDAQKNKSVVSMENFNSHAHVERDMLCIARATAPENFNSHAHVERDPGFRVRLP